VPVSRSFSLSFAETAGILLLLIFIAGLHSVHEEILKVGSRSMLLISHSAVYKQVQAAIYILAGLLLSVNHQRIFQLSERTRRNQIAKSSS
jgi:hypothetical protein